MGSLVLVGSLAQKPRWSGLRSENEEMATAIGGQRVKEFEGIGSEEHKRYAIILGCYGCK